MVEFGYSRKCLLQVMEKEDLGNWLLWQISLKIISLVHRLRIANLLSPCISIMTY